MEKKSEIHSLVWPNFHILYRKWSGKILSQRNSSTVSETYNSGCKKNNCVLLVQLTYSGSFKNDLMHGIGKFQDTKGSIREGIWQNGMHMTDLN